MLDLIKGAKFEKWMELEQGYSIAGDWLTANVDARRIRTVLEKFAEMKEGQNITLWIEEAAGLDDENEVKKVTRDSMGIVENITYEVWYLDGLNAALISQILDFSGELLINDGLAYVGLLSDDGDEIGKYQCNIMRAHSGTGSLMPIRKMLEENRIPYRENLATAWDLSSDDCPVISSRFTIGGQTVADTIRILEGMGLYKAEVRQTNDAE
ncbi:MAG: hypothetical protein E7240_06175 [Lachnospiraceae bacterium]|nr:hypothetical protein [Lachnospiraceae bacterium]